MADLNVDSIQSAGGDPTPILVESDLQFTDPHKIKIKTIDSPDGDPLAIEGVQFRDGQILNLDIEGTGGAAGGLTVEVEQIATAPNSTLNPLPWIDSLNDYFYEVAGVPKVIIGGSKAFTEASAKIAYLAFQQTTEEDQLFIEEQVLLQLGLEIELEFPASLENELISDNNKDATNGAAQPNEVTAGVGQ